jgi:hypothetical protein
MWMLCCVVLCIVCVRACVCVLRRGLIETAGYDVLWKMLGSIPRHTSGQVSSTDVYLCWVQQLLMHQIT